MFGLAGFGSQGFASLVLRAGAAQPARDGMTLDSGPREAGAEPEREMTVNPDPAAEAAGEPGEITVDETNDE